MSLPEDAEAVLREIANAMQTDAPLPSPLRHATLASNVQSIMSEGIDPRRWGAVHGGMDVHAAVPCVYLAQASQSNNLHASLFAGGASAVVVIDVDAACLDPESFMPDDALYVLWERGEIFEDADEMVEELEIAKELAERYLSLLESASDEDLPLLLKPLWRWHFEREGELAYSGNVPPSAILSVRRYGEEPVAYQPTP